MISGGVVVDKLPDFVSKRKFTDDFFSIWKITKDLKIVGG